MDTSLIVIILVGAAFALFYLNRIKNSKNMIPPQKFKELLEEDPGIIIDVRTKGEFKSGHLKEVDHNFDVTSGEFNEKVRNLDKNKVYYLYCRTGARSGQAVNIMKRNNFENVYNVGGLQSLVNAGFKQTS
ncbi:rhodanese-like domain-containing protein [Aliifodinibius salicampi]|uniref:Rhodanese-like domain-containing protein n=1 Tax=Fodinibius salicampi TaxID=1920655 RepID=A0ABT3Q268_9BACT|nr:rhodanese-like domain-containing protein [Fodinibius salicampi]MCW9714202.1 rhodanese-like domain-containing protein [Fodinibius salicampi]